MNKQFNTTALKLTPANAIIELQHQANHYKNIIRPRKISTQISNREHDRKKVFSSFVDNKFQKEKRQKIQRQNFRIFKDCEQIYKAKGILQKVEDLSHQIQKYTKKSLISSFLIKEKVQKIKKQNSQMKKRLQMQKPVLEGKEQWKKHQTFTKQMISKLRTKSKSQICNPEILFKIVTNSERDKTSYLQLFRTFSLQKKSESPSKQKSSEKVQKRRRRKNKKIIQSTISFNQTQKYQQTPEVSSIQEQLDLKKIQPQEEEILTRAQQLVLRQFS